MKYKLGELVQNVSNNYDFNGKDKVMFLNTSDIYDGKIGGIKYDVVSLPGQAKKSIENGDILFSEIRPKNKRFALVRNIDAENYVVSTKLMVLRNIKKDILNTEYLYLFLSSPSMVKYFQSEAESRSGTFPQLTFKANMANIEMEIPSITKQKQIVKQIGTFTNKIVVNNQINDNLFDLVA